jgi:uncharacterized membrane protein
MAMKVLWSLLRTTLVGVVTIAVLAFAVEWLVRAIVSLVGPLVHIMTTTWELSDYVAGVIVVAIAVAACFAVGLFVKTKVGAWLLRAAESRLMRRAPGYVWIRDAIGRVLGTQKPLFSSAALVEVSDGALCTAFVTDTHADGSFTVFIPASPNPMSGSVYHLKREHVHVLDVPVEVAWSSVVSCGAGAGKLMEVYRKSAVQQ